MKNKQHQTDIEEFIDKNVSSEEHLLFSIRKVDSAFAMESIDQNLQHQIAQLLTCPLCDQLLSDPVFLGCSHRFCSSCLHVFLKQKMKKCCPACSDIRPITAVRKDAKYDENTSKLLKIINNFPYLQEKASMKANLCISLKRMEVCNQSKQHIQSIKRFKHNDLSSESIIKTSSCENQSLNATTSLNVSFIKNFQVYSSQSNQSLSSAQNFSFKASTSQVASSSASISKSFQNYSIINQDLSLNQSNQSSFSQVHQEDQRVKDSVILKAYKHFNLRTQNNANNSLNMSLQNMSIDLDYQIQKYNILRIKIKKYQEDFFTPPLDFTEMYLASNKSSNVIKKTISQCLNCSQHKIKIFLYNSKTNGCTLISEDTRLDKLFPKKGFKIDAVDSQSISSIIELYNRQGNEKNSHKRDGKIYYRVIS